MWKINLTAAGIATLLLVGPAQAYLCDRTPECTVTSDGKKDVYCDFTEDDNKQADVDHYDVDDDGKEEFKGSDSAVSCRDVVPAQCKEDYRPKPPKPVCNKKIDG